MESSETIKPLRIFCWGVLHAIGLFDLMDLTATKKDVDLAEYRIWFGLGEVCMAGLLAGIIAIPVGCWFAGRTELSLAIIGAAVIFLPLFVFLPRLIRFVTDADTDAVLAAFGRNEQVKKVFWALFIATAGLVLAQVVDPATAQKIVSIITGIIP
jgi:F0F1-type ATP synthase assembly protein I